MIAEQIRDVILPLVEVQPYEDGFRMVTFHGTCFLIGKRGYALTNSHLLGVAENNILGAMTVSEDNTWEFHPVEQFEPHESEDITLLKLSGHLKESFLRISPESAFQSLEYRQFSYPEDQVNELEINGHIVKRPDLVYLQGYIRRRLSQFNLYTIRGSEFYELSEPGFIGSSGSPVIKKQSGEYWDVIGVYAGINTISYNNESHKIGYCVRSDFIANWKPAILGKELHLEF